MRPFLLAVVTIGALAALGGWLLEAYAARDADETLRASSARVGEGGSVEHRDFMGPAGERPAAD